MLRFRFLFIHYKDFIGKTTDGVLNRRQGFSIIFAPSKNRGTVHEEYQEFLHHCSY